MYSAATPAKPLTNSTTTTNTAAAVASSQIWNSNGSTSNLNGNNGNGVVGAGVSSGLQLPQKILAGTATPLKGSNPATPARQASAELEGAGDKAAPRTDVDSLMDAVGASGVDIDAEEEAMRLANQALHQTIVHAGPFIDRSRKQDFIDPNVLAECVKKIAAAFQLRTLEPDTIPLIALATRHRLMALINSAIETRDHRINSSHLRPPPSSTIPIKRSRSASIDEAPTEDEESDFDEEEEEEDRRRRKGKGKAIEVKGWDQIIYDDQEKILSVLEKVEREEERKKRRERMVRDQKEQEEKDLVEAIAASEAANAEIGSQSTGNAIDNLVMGSGTPASGTSTPRGGGGGGGGGGGFTGELGKDGKPKKEVKKKPKKDNPGNLSEVVKKKMTDQVAMRSIGGRKFSWATAGFSSPTPGGMSTPGGGLPAPRFPSSGLSGLPAPNFGTPLAGSSQPFSKAAFPTNNNGNSSTFNPLARLSNVPLLHEANRSEIEKAEWERGKSVVELGDIVFALERERGMGVGKGSGRNALIKSRAGLKGKPNRP